MKKTKKKKVVKKEKVAPRRPQKKAAPKRAVSQKPIGRVTHFFGHIKVAIIKFKKPVPVGKEIRIKGATTDFRMAIASMQYDHKPVSRAKKNQEVGVKVPKKVREGDLVFEA